MRSVSPAHRLLSIIFTTFVAQAVPASQLTPAQRDTHIATTLKTQGDCRRTQNVVLCVEQKQFDENTLTTFLALADQGAIAIKRYLGKQLDNPGSASAPVEFFVHDDVGIPHTTILRKPWIFMHRESLAENMAPYLHEMVHAMAQWSWRNSEWIGEGFANHVAAYIAQHHGGYHRSFILPDGLARLQELRQSNAGKTMLPLIGAVGRRNHLTGQNAKLFKMMMNDRQTLAPAYYAMSWSFTHYLITQMGMDGLRQMAESDKPSSVCKKLTGKTLQQQKERWQRQLDESSA